MADPQYQDFDKRMRRVARAHRRGRGFEAPGTYPRAQYRAQPRQANFLRPLMLIVAAGMALKALMFMHVGELDYRTRVAQLQNGPVVEQIGAYVMQPDAATKWLAGLFELVLTSPTHLKG